MASWPDFRVFFFSSRRRHTRCLSDWSSDVCSSDLVCRVEDRDSRRHGDRLDSDSARHERMDRTMKWKTARGNKRVGKSSAGSLNTRLPQTGITGGRVRRAGPRPFDRIADVDVNPGWREGKVYYAHIGCGSAQGQRQADKDPTNETVTDQAQ